MWTYDKKLEFPVKIKNPDPRAAQIIISQLGGPDGEIGAAMRYLNQRYSMPYDKVVGILTDVGTEELAHIEMVAAILYQLTRNLTPEQIKNSGFDTYFVDHTTGVYPQSAAGVPFSAAALQCKGDVITDLMEDLAAEQKARTTYDNILRLVDDPDVREPIKFLREREVVHFQRFGDALRAGVALVAFVTFYAEGGDAGIGIADPPVAVCADKGRETVYTVFTVCAVLTIFTIFAILAVRTGSASAAARADQRCKPFLLRADKAVLHRDVVGGKPDDIAR